MNRENTIYADFEFNSDDMFVVTPEGNYFNFSGYTEDHAPETIMDPKSHIVYTVVFNG